MNTTTRRQLESRLLGLMSAIVILVVILMPFHAFISTWLGTSIGPLLVWKSWKEILLVGLAPFVIWYLYLRPDIFRTLWRRWVNKLIVLYTVLHIALSFISTASSQAILAGLMMNLRFLAIFLLVQVIVEGNPPYLKRFTKRTPRWLLWITVVLGVMAILQVFVLPKDFLVHFGYAKDATIAPYILVDQNQNAVRAFATMRGPNTLGAYLLLPLAIAVYSLYKRRNDWLALAAFGLGLVAIFLTGSRSAWLGLIVTILVLGASLIPKPVFIKWAKRSIIPVIILIAAIGWATIKIPAVQLAILHTSPTDVSSNKGSNVAHWEATSRGISDVVRHPLGSGPGSAGPASFYNASGSNLSENYYVQIAQEVGIIGLALFIAINVLTIVPIVRRGRDLLPAALTASFFGIALINFFLHGWADDPTSLTWWALAGLYMGKK